MPKKHTSGRWDAKMLEIVDMVVARKLPKSDRTRYMEEATWEKLRNDPDASDLMENMKRGDTA